jgi:hypothetical protein
MISCAAILQDRQEDILTVRVSEAGIAASFRMRHHSEDIPGLIDDSRDVPERSVRVRIPAYFSLIITVTEDDPPITLKALDRLFISEVISLPMGDGD